MTSLQQVRWFEGVMYTAYGDESADETKQRVFAIAGLFGNTSDWSVFRKKWRTRTRGKIFHATQCDSDQGPYEHTDHQDNKKLYADLTHIIADSKLIGYAVAISLSDYNELLAPKLDKEPYYICFTHVVINLARQAAVCIPRDRLKFTFDRNMQIEYNAGQLYDGIIKRHYEGIRELMDDEIAFATRKTIGIQAADLVAREAMKLLDNQEGPIRRPTRLSTQVLQACKRIKFEQLRRQWFEYTIQRAANAHAMYPKAEYKEWLAQQGLQPTIANKLRYEIIRRSITKDESHTGKEQCNNE